jgi:hypothetical protein
MDHRDRAAIEGRWYDAFDEATMLATIEDFEDEDCDECPPDDDCSCTTTTVEVPCVFVVCSTCDGKGSHVNPSVDSHGISSEEFAEDPDFREEYLAGRYDVPCYECQGLRVVPAPDEDHLSPRQRRAVEHQRTAQRERVADARYRYMESGGY